jgi:hypothetical protein
MGGKRCWWCHELVLSAGAIMTPRWLARLWGRDGRQFGYKGYIHVECREAMLREEDNESFVSFVAHKRGEPTAEVSPNAK